MGEIGKAFELNISKRKKRPILLAGKKTTVLWVCIHEVAGPTEALVPVKDKDR